LAKRVMYHLVAYAEVEMYCSVCRVERSALVKMGRRGGTTHEGLVNVGHEQLDEALLNVERLDKTRKAGLEDVSKLVLVEEADEAGVGSLRERKGGISESSAARREAEQLTSGSK